MVLLVKIQLVMGVTIGVVAISLLKGPGVEGAPSDARTLYLFIGNSKLVSFCYLVGWVS